MDEARVRFLFGDDVDPDEVATESDRLLVLEDQAGDAPPAMVAVRAAVANQILDDNPPEVWLHAQRLLDLGLDRQVIIHQLALAFLPTIERALMADHLGHERRPEDAPDPDVYLGALARLPIPTARDAESAIVDLVRARPGIPSSELVEAARLHLGREEGDLATDSLLDRQYDELVDIGVIDYVGNDQMVFVRDVVEGIVLTHRLTAEEADHGVIEAGFDLGAFNDRDDLALPDDGWIEIVATDPDHVEWRGPDGWLDRFSPGDVLAVRVDEDDEVTIEVVPEPGADSGLLDRFSEAYDERVAEPWVPVDGRDLVISLQFEDRETFSAPRLPLADLAEAAGLERRGSWVAHEESVWRSQAHLRQIGRVSRRLAHRDDDAGSTASRILLRADLLAGTIDEEEAGLPLPDDDVLRSHLADLRDEDIVTTVAAELALLDDGGATADALVAALRGAAERRRDHATAHLLAALVAERVPDPIAAEQHLHLANAADPDHGLVIDRLGWYASDRGNAPEALRWWRQLEPLGPVQRDIDSVKSYAAPKAATIGRNEPCWCGSGRKYKQCHLGEAGTAPLPDRVSWLCRKATGFVDRRPETRQDVLSVVFARALHAHEDSIDDALADPIVMDLVLTELGWFETFLAERGALLPDDEALLARSWTLVERTVYEVVEVDRGVGLVVRDLRTGEQLRVRERTFSGEAAPGELVCARAVPDGETNQFVGSVFEVRVGTERALLDLLDHGEPLDIAEWVRNLYAPPRLATREGEPMVLCELTFSVPDADLARAFLDETYEPDDRPDTPTGSWAEWHPIHDDERILRSTLRLDGAQLLVSANSDIRADRVIATVLTGIPGADLVDDDRTEADATEIARIAAEQRAQLGGNDLPGLPDHAMSPPDDPALAAALAEVRARQEERWCDESIPALTGLTPREAAADPTRREELLRLLASFDRIGDGSDGMTMRPARLRELLDLT